MDWAFNKPGSWGMRGRLQVAYQRSVIVVVFCKKLPQYVVGNITFYKENEWACDGNSDNAFHTWLQLSSCIFLNGLPTKYHLIYLLKLAILVKFRQLTWRFLCKLFQQRWAWRDSEFDDFDDFYGNYVSANLTITRDGSNVLANLAIFMQITSPEMGLTCWRIWRFRLHQEWRPSINILISSLHDQRWV